jgi:hypothetical protein
MEKTQPRPVKQDTSAPQVDVDRSPVRCPYCHDHCGPEDEAAIVCRSCLSRHHGACWREGQGCCASCGSKRALTGAPRQVEVAKAELELIRRGLAREAVERLRKREDVTELAATTALLEAASRELDQSRRLPPGAIVAIVAIVLTFSIPLLAILLGR